MPKFANISIDGNQTQDVYNKKDLKVSLNWENNNELAESLTITDYEFVRDANELLIAKATTPSPGNVSFTEGIPFKIDQSENGVTENVFDGYLDMTAENEYDLFKSTIKAVDRKNVDWLYNVADGFSFEYLKEIGVITDGDAVAMPYCINAVPNYTETAIMLISTYTLVSQIQEKVQQIIALGIEMSNPFEATAIVRMISYVLYLTLFLAALVVILKQLFDSIIQPVKYHKGVYTKDMLTKGAAYLGLNFKSTIFDSQPFADDFYLCEKISSSSAGNSNGVFGFLTPDAPNTSFVPTGTFGDFLRLQCTKFNARIYINGNDLHLLRQNEVVTPVTAYTLPPVKMERFRLNVSDFKSNLFYKFQTDTLDLNTIDKYQGTSYQVQCEAISVVNKDLRTMKGFEQVDLGVALAKVKTELNLPEKLIKIFGDVFDPLVNALVASVNVIIGVANRITKTINKIIKGLKIIGIKIGWEIKPIPYLQKINISGTITNRIGMMVLQNDFTGVAKSFILPRVSDVNKRKPHANNGVIYSAKYFYEQFYIGKSFVPTASLPNANQFFIHELANIPCKLSDFVTIKNRNRIFLTDGTPAIVKRLDWDYYNEKMDLVIWINKLYTNNIRETFIETDGL